MNRIIIVLIACILMPGTGSFVFAENSSRLTGNKSESIVLKNQDTIVLTTDEWSAIVKPEKFSIDVKLAGDKVSKSVAGKSAAFRNFAELEIDKQNRKASWIYPDLDLSAEIKVVSGRLKIKLSSGKEQRIVWPLNGADKGIKALILPDNAGLYIPAGNSVWKKVFNRNPCRSTHERLSMPFWAYSFEKTTVTYFLEEDLDSELCVRMKKKAFDTRLHHKFSQREGLPDYTLYLAFGPSSPLTAAKEYRSYLIENKKFVTLAEKFKQLPEAKKLLGAPHSYVWRDGRSIEALKMIKKIGFERLLIAYDQDVEFESEPHVNSEYVALAKSYGFIVSPYEIFTKLDPLGVDHTNFSQWTPDIYPEACIRKRNGKLERGWGYGRDENGNRLFGCELSSEALIRYQPVNDYLGKRLKTHTDIGVNSVFYDEDAYGEFYEDFDVDHPMTFSKDRSNRLRRMLDGINKNLIVGSETATGWFVPYIHFSHGNHTIHNSLWFNFSGNSDVFGSWSPRREKNRFIKKVNTPKLLKQTIFNPVYRLPLYQAVFHDSIIATDRYDISPVKLKDLVVRRELMQLLYNIPPIWSFDKKEIKMYKERASRSYKVFAAIHRKTGALELTDFRWLSSDRLVQQTKFGDTLSLTANFSDKKFQDIPPRCLGIHWLKKGDQSTYCPQPCSAQEDCFSNK